MTTITDQLAEALRKALNESEEVPASFIVSGSTWWATAYRALAVYDAQREKHPDTDAFVAAAESSHDADYYQMTDEPIDRVDDGAWVTIRAFVSNEEAGLGSPDEGE